MKILVVGAGAREHAICWRLAREGVTVVVAPGNPLMTDVADVRANVALADHEGLVALARKQKVDLVVVGPESPLVAGLVDRLTTAGIPVFGPSAAAARLEASKSFARDVCVAAAVPMAAGLAFDHVQPALEYAELMGGSAGVVVKADGLAAGKGVAVCDSFDEAERAVRDALELDRFGASGRRVVIEERLDGVEASVIAICDGRDAVLLPAARDHKRLLDGDLGPNTGGMGAYSPVAELTDVDLLRLRTDLFRSVLAEMSGRGITFRGALFAGLMLTADGPRVLEFNVRLGDPEAQVMLPRLQDELAPLLAAAATGSLNDAEPPPILRTGPDVAVGLTLAADGYPDAPRAGDHVSGIAEAREGGALVLGAGVRTDPGKGMVTAGGRVLTVVGSGPDVEAAAEAAYEAAGRITFAGRQMRTDIGRSLVGVAA
jgi:phosphoribosylamine--glycine ligase